MRDDACRQKLHVVERCAAIGELARDHLALLGDAEAPGNGARRLRRDRPPGWCAAAAYRTSAAMKEADLDVSPLRSLDDLALRLDELEGRAEESAVLVRVGIAEHDLLNAAMVLDIAADRREAREFADDRGGPPQVLDGLEQRHDAQLVGVDAGETGEAIDRQK